MIYSPKASVVMSGIFGRDKCAANLVMAMCLWCTADSLAVNHPNCSFSLLSKSCDYRQSSMFSPWNRCGVLSFKQRSHRSLRNAPIRGFAIPEVWLPTKGFWSALKSFLSFNERLMGWQGNPSTPVWPFFKLTGHWACPCAIFLQYREAHYPFRFSSDGELTT